MIMRGAGVVVVLLVAATSITVLMVQATPRSFNDRNMHPLPRLRRGAPKLNMREGEDTAEFWREQAQKTISDKLSTKPNTNIAKNVILFLGDGMSIPTLMAARVWMNQKDGKENGEENFLSFEKFPYTGLSKTYCVDKQVADSACSASAYLCGVKSNEGTIGITAKVPLGDCFAALDESTHLSSIARWFQLKGKKSGVVTTTRITHASPAGVYANTAHRDWESDDDLNYGNGKPCTDIAHQLIHGDTGKNLNVILGGGRAKFYSTNEEDPEGVLGNRTDRNLINDWISLKKDKGGRYVWNRSDLLGLSSKTEYALGLFESDHCQYEMERNNKTDPSLTEMTETAIRLLSNSPEGYFLFVEGGRIDHAHHDAHAKKALDETLEFSNAIKRAVEMTSRADTLIVVTSDHAHTMTVSGYSVRGNDILGVANLADDHLHYATLSYANGPGYRIMANGSRYNLLDEDMKNNNYTFPSTAPLEQETHGGDDVGIFAIGPWAHLLVGSIEQNTYCIDKQVADSACTATAYLTGVKANEGTIGVTGAVLLGDCAASLPIETHVDSIAKWAQVKGKKTGLVTTTRVTHASPAGVYSHTAHRDWENDAETANAEATECADIAHQLVSEETGAKLNVILGGGRQNFYMTTESDPEYPNDPQQNGKRINENLVDKWMELKDSKGTYVKSRNELLDVPDNTEYLLGLFEPDHCQYELDRNKESDPSLTEMMEKAISLLHNTEEGYFLFVEGGRIDHAHHNNLAQKALSETVEFSNAIQRARELTASADTLIVVTADHAHTMSVSGYPWRGNDILGQPDEAANDNIPYSTISYANGPGYQKDVDDVRFDISQAPFGDKEFAFPSIAPLDSETHGGDDVGIFAIGPWAHLLTGSIEQNVIPHVMAYASCVGEGATVCDAL